MNPFDLDDIDVKNRQHKAWTEGYVAGLKWATDVADGIYRTPPNNPHEEKQEAA